MRAASLLLLLFLASGCRLNAECFGSDECSDGRVCRAGACVLADSTSDAGLDAGDVGSAGDDAALDASVDSGLDAGLDGGAAPDGGGCTVQRGRQLADHQHLFDEDRLLLHFEDQLPLAAAALDTSAPSTLSPSCIGATCPASDCGAYGLGARFDGLDDVLLVEGTTYFYRDDSRYFLEAWINLDPARTARGCIFEYLDASDQPTELGFCVEPDGALSLNATPRIISTIVPAQEWHHVAVLRSPDDDTFFFYVDGAQVDTATRAIQGGATGGSLRIGAGFAGVLDEVRLSQRLLTPGYDFSISQTERALLYERERDVWISGGRGQAPRFLLARAARPKWSNDGSELAYLRCPEGQDGGCTWYRANRDLGNERILANNAARVSGAWGIEEPWFYFVRGAGCTRTIQRVHINTGSEEEIFATDGWTGLDTGGLFTPELRAIYAAREDCGNGGGIVVRADLEPAQPVYTAEPGEEYGQLRAQGCHDCPAQFLFLRDEEMFLGYRTGGMPMSFGTGITSMDYFRGNRAYLANVPGTGACGNGGICLLDFNFGSILQLFPTSTVAIGFPSYNERE